MPIAENVNQVAASNLLITATTLWDEATLSQTKVISANGRYYAFVSDEITTNNNKAIDATLSISSFEKNRQSLGKSKAMFVLERKDSGGNWHPYHTLYKAIDAISYDHTENGGIIPDQQLSIGPSLLVFESREVSASDGASIILEDHPKNGVLPAVIRLVLVLHERDYGGVGPFESIRFTIDYELRAE